MDSNPKFTLVVLGAGGGPGSQDLFCFIVAPFGSNDFVAIDAGTLLPGIIKAIEKKSLPKEEDALLNPEIAFLRKRIKSFLITHAHLDHIESLVIDAQSDGNKYVLGIDRTINDIRDHLFNWAVWPNFGNEGKDPLGQYEYIRLPLYKKTEIPLSQLTVEAYPLHHPGSYIATAYLIEKDGCYIAFVVNTSPDSLEKEKYLQKFWERLLGPIKQKKLRAIVIECSYPDNRPDDKLFGHLKPSYLIQELEQLASMADPIKPQESLKDVKILVMHMKRSSEKNSYQDQIKDQILKLNKMQFNFLFPSQAERFDL